MESSVIGNSMLLLERRADIGAAKRFLFEKPHVPCYVLTEELQKELLKEGLQTEWLGVPLSESDVRTLEQTSWQVADHWFEEPALLPYLTYRGYNLGFLSGIHIGMYMTWILGLRMQLSRIIRQRRIRQIYLFSGETELLEKKHFFDIQITAEYCRNLVQHMEIDITVLQEDTVPLHLKKRPHLDFQHYFKQIGRFLIQYFYRLISFLRKAASQPQKGKTLIICAAIHHVSKIFERQTSWRSIVYLDEEFRAAKVPFLLKHHIEYLSYRDLRRKIPKSSNESLLKYRQSAQQNLNEVLSLIREKRLFFDEEGEDISDILKTELTDLLTVKLPEIASYVEIFDLLFQSRSADACLVDEDTLAFRRSLICSAKHHGAMTFEIPHGVNFEYMQHDLIPVTVDKVMVGGPAIRDYYIKNGVEPEKICVTGLPRFYPPGSPYLRKMTKGIHRKLGVSASRPLICLATTAFWPTFELHRRWSEYQAAVADFFKVLPLTYPDYFLLIKLHPMDSHYQWMIPLLEKNKIKRYQIVQHTNMSALIEASHVVVSFHSNIVIESILLRKPTVILDYFPFMKTGIPLFETHLGEVFCARNAQSLAGLLQKIRFRDRYYGEQLNIAQTWFRDQWINHFDRQASEIIAKTLIQLIQKSGDPLHG